MLLMLLTLIGITLSAVAGPAQQWFAGLPQTLQTIERKVRPLQKALSRIELLTSRADAAGVGERRSRSRIAPAAGIQALPRRSARPTSWWKRARASSVPSPSLF